MATTTTTEMQIKLKYDDGLTRTYKIPNVNYSYPSASIRSAVAEFNSRAVTGDDTNLVFVSKENGNCTGVESVTIIQTTEELIYGN